MAQNNMEVFLRQEDKKEAEETLSYVQSNDVFRQLLMKTFLDGFNAGRMSLEVKKPA